MPGTSREAGSLRRSAPHHDVEQGRTGREEASFIARASLDVEVYFGDDSLTLPLLAVGVERSRGSLRRRPHGRDLVIAPRRVWRTTAAAFAGVGRAATGRPRWPW